MLHDPASLLSGLPFSLTLLTILLAHEFGHFLACLYYRVDASRRSFCPFPPRIGTFGRVHPHPLAHLFETRAVRYRHRGTAGRVFSAAAGAGDRPRVFEGDPGHRGSGRDPVRRPADVRLLRWRSFRRAGPDIYLHPVARAAWVGMLATALNLLPIGQLDGGHILYSFAGQRTSCCRGSSWRC